MQGFRFLIWLDFLFVQNVHNFTKWLQLFKSAAQENSFTLEAWLECGTEVQVAAASQAVPFLLSDSTMWSLLPTVWKTLFDLGNLVTLRQALVAFGKELAPFIGRMHLEYNLAPSVLTEIKVHLKAL